MSSSRRTERLRPDADAKPDSPGDLKKAGSRAVGCLRIRQLLQPGTEPGVGALVAIIVWILASAAFGFYIANFSSYNKTYGTFAGVIVFLLWRWITNLALLFGAELDAELERGRELQAGIAAERTIQLPPRDTRNIDKARAKEDKDVGRGRRLRRSHGQDQKHED